MHCGKGSVVLHSKIYLEGCQERTSKQVQDRVEGDLNGKLEMTASHILKFNVGHGTVEEP